jgi:hypothetical protein
VRQPALRLRVTLGQEPELRCPHCGEWWTLTPDCWRLNDWDKCLACQRERARLYSLLRMRDKEYRTAKADYSRRYRAWLAATCPQYLPAYERERAAQRREYAKQRRARLRDAA